MSALRIPALFLLLFLLLPTPSFSHDNHSESAALLAAENFLNLLDSSEFELAWSQTGMLNQSYNLPPEWFKKLLAVRPHLGQALSRSVKTTSHHQAWVGLPDGEYLRVSFSTTFLNKQNALETVVLVKEGSDWMVSSYHLR